jgi:hypothetical protein
MTFFYRAGWQVQFIEADLKTPLPGRNTVTAYLLQQIQATRMTRLLTPA